MTITTTDGAGGIGPIEAAAIAMWQEESRRCLGGPRRILWEDESPTERKKWVGLALAAQSALAAPRHAGDAGVREALVLARDTLLHLAKDIDQAAWLTDPWYGSSSPLPKIEAALAGSADGICGCGHCSPSVTHDATCAVHNAPALPVGPCDCGAALATPADTGLGLGEAMRIARAGFEAWAAKPHNAKWARKIDGTPIPNDLPICIAQAFVDAAGLITPAGQEKQSWPAGYQKTFDAISAAISPRGEVTVGISVKAFYRALGYPEAAAPVIEARRVERVVPLSGPKADEIKRAYSEWRNELRLQPRNQSFDAFEAGYYAALDAAPAIEAGTAENDVNSKSLAATNE